jgi:acyl-CoA thioester hydrolase
VTRRGASPFFDRDRSAPAPLTARIRRRVGFNEVDLMRIVWHGRYAVYFEDASAELRRQIGLSYQDFFEAGLQAPIIQFHVEYLRPLRLDEEFEARASLIWSDAARLNTEYEIVRNDGVLAAAGCTVQLLTDAVTGEVCMAMPQLIERCRARWQAGELKALQ